MPKTPAPKTLRTMVLRALLGFLVLTALIAIIDVWTDIDEEGRVLMSSVVLTVASLLALPGAAQVDRNKQSSTGVATLLLVPVAVLTTLWLIWFEPQNPDLLIKVVATAWLWSLTVSLHALVMLARLPDRAAWLKFVAPGLTHAGAVMATLSIYQVLVFEDVTRYSTATIYILAGLANLAVLIMHVMDRYERGASQQLVLDEDGDQWRDCRSGRRYRITEA
jgi:hypothetical protein